MLRKVVDLIKVSDWINHLSTGRVALAALILFLVFSALVLPDQAAKAEFYARDAGSPDTSLFYTADEIYQFAEAYGPQGRSAYIRARFTFDIIWPVVYVLFLSTCISWVWKRVQNKGQRWGWLNLTPVFGMLFDFLENSSAAIVMARYPVPTPVLDHLAGVFTFVKWLFIGISFIALFLGLILIIWGRIKHSD